MGVELNLVFPVNELLGLIVARQKIVRRDPRNAAVPALHVGRGEKILPQVGEEVGANQRRREFTLQHADAAHQPLHGAFHLIANHRIRIELFALEHRAQQGLELAVGPAEGFSQARHQFVGRIFAGKKSPKLGRDEAGCLRLSCDLVEHIHPSQRAGFAQNRLEALVMDERAIVALLAEAITNQAGECAGCFRDVSFGIMAFSQGEKLHHLARVILIRMLLAALRLIEPDQHGRIAGDGREHLPPTPRGQPPERIILKPHQVGVSHLVDAGREVAVPEERQLLLERARPFGHPLQPPAPQFQHLPALLLLLFTHEFTRLLLQRHALLLRGSAHFLPDLTHLLALLDLVRIRFGPRRIRGVIGNRFIIHERSDGTLQPHLFQFFNFSRRPSEPGPVKQVCSGGEIPLGCWQ